MRISDVYNIENIITNLEIALQINGSDYGQKDLNVAIEKIKARIKSQYQIDLTENLSYYHAQLCGYLHIARYTGEVIAKPIKISYLGIEKNSLMSSLRRLQTNKTISGCKPIIDIFKQNMGYTNNCLEKRLFFILIVCYELEYFELTSALSEILYLGDKLM